jgi:hypothetical protein
VQEHHVTFLVDAPTPRVWRALHPRWPDGPGPHVVDYPGGRIEILFAGNEADQGLVPAYLLSHGKATSWECIVEARLGEYARYVAIGKPLWSRAEGWHRLTEESDGRTRLTFHETYHANNLLLRLLLERRVHTFISDRNNASYTALLGRLGPIERVV